MLELMESVINTCLAVEASIEKYQEALSLYRQEHEAQEAIFELLYEIVQPTEYEKELHKLSARFTKVRNVEQPIDLMKCIKSRYKEIMILK